MILSPHQEMLKELYKLNPDDCLKSIAEKLKEIFSCQTVCILLWNEGKQKLITEYWSGMPKELGRPEEYGLNEGVTGNVIFSQGRSVICLVDMSARKIFDELTHEYLQDSSTKWENMEAYAQSTKHGFESLLGAPLFVRNQKLGAVKLLNKLNPLGEIEEEGFDESDLKDLSYFLDAIEYVVGIKRYEKQVQSLLGIGQKIISAGFNYQDILDDIALRCADAMNYRICLIRILEDKSLELRATSPKPLSQQAAQTKHSPSAKAIEHKIPLKFVYQGETEMAELSLEAVDTQKKIRLSKINPDFVEFVRQYDIRSSLVVPIHDGQTVIGTIECYTTLPRDFSLTELNTLRMYVDAVVISTLKAREQGLLRNLIDMQRIDTIADAKGEESRIIRSVLDHTKKLLGRRLKVLSAIFFEERLARSGLNCDHLYGSREKVLKSVLGKKRFDAIFSQTSESQSHTRKPPTVLRTSNSSSGSSQDLDIITADILPDPEAPPLGVLLLGVQSLGSSDSFPTQVAEVSADSLAVTLANIQEIRRSKILINMVDTVSKKETLSEIYEFILKKTTDFFGFDFGSITKIDYANHQVKTVKCHSVKPDLVDPNKWKDLSAYEWNDKDILVDVFRKKEPEVIDALRPDETPDPRLNLLIYTTFNHKDLARVWVPFVFRTEQETRPGSDQRPDDQLVLGIIEAGYHRQTQDHIAPHQKETFVRFIDSCANTLQRSTLLEERSSVEDIVRRFNERKSDEHPDEVLRMLLEDSVNLVKADSGDITFLTHRDEKVRFLREGLAYGIPAEKLDKLVRELEVTASGKCGFVGYVAATGLPYWNNVNDNQMYRREFPEVQSELVVPLRFSGQVFAFLNINSHQKDWFDDRKASLVQTVAEKGAVLYQNARVIWPLYSLVSPFNPFATAEQIYEQVIGIIERFLETETVSVWQKHTERNSFKLELVAASSKFWEKYKEAGITSLKPDTFTGRAASGEEPQVQVSEEEMELKPQFFHKEFARENRLRSMTAVPIQVGDEIYGAIDVFSRRDTKLFEEEVVILRIIASKAAIALQSAMLLESFSKVAKTAPDEDITSILEAIAQNALEMLHAEPVILFRYDASAKKGKQFDVEAVIKGKIYHSLRLATNDNHLANMILERDKPLYLRNEDDYLRFEKESKRVWRSDRFKEDFWHREKIASLAALKLEHRGEIMGVMFINYRTPQKFSEASERLMKIFAAHAASAIYNAKIDKRNNEFWETRRADSLSLNVSEIVYSMAHNQGNLLDQISYHVSTIEPLLLQPENDAAQKALVKHVEEMKQQVELLLEEHRRLKRYRQVDALRKEPHDINRLTEWSLDMIRDSLEKRKIKIDDRYGAKLPLVNCDENQIQHVLVNLFLNARDAMPTGGKLTVSTSFNAHTGTVEIRVIDTGRGVPVENRNQIFEPNFTTKPQKAGGSGFGLPISQYILARHGGSIELGPSSTAGATFTVVLPVSGE